MDLPGRGSAAGVLTELQSYQVRITLDDQPPLSVSLGPADVGELRRQGSKVFAFEVTAKAGTRRSLVVVAAADASVGATSRNVFTVPKPPKLADAVAETLR